jgi:hypothetical protein
MGISLPTRSLKLTDKKIIKFSFVLAFCLTLALGATAQTGSVGIGTDNPKPEAILDIDSKEKGLLIPRLDENERDALTAKITAAGSPNAEYNGMLIYVTDNVNGTQALNVWQDDKWVEVGTGGAGGGGGAAIESAEVNSDGKIVLYMTDGTEVEVEGDVRGRAGSEWHSGSGHPNSAGLQARPRDFYYRTDNNTIWKFSDFGVWSQVVALSGGGAGGGGTVTTISSVDVDPSGAMTLTLSDNTTLNVNGNVKGPKGDGGAVWYSGSDNLVNLPANAPAAAKEGDLYLNTTTREVYQRGASAWTKTADLALGSPGVGITLASIVNKKLVLRYTNGTRDTVGVVVGTDGKSAYQSWLDAGNVGTEAQFLTSLKGADGSNGTNGTNGQSAYELWLTQPGNAGKTLAQFLTAIEGQDGVGIQSALINGDGELVLNYTTGTASTVGVVKGADGANGKSAYQTWLDAGNVGTEAQFLTALKGADGTNGTNGANGANGTNGQSAYELWLTQPGNAGKTEAQFLAALEGADGANGAPGSQWFTGSTVPDGTTPAAAVDGDMYFNSSNNTIYKKAAGAWTSTVVISPTNAWSLTGNTGIAASAFIGTIDARDVVVKTSNIERMRIRHTTGNVGIGTNASDVKLHVNGDFRLGQGGNVINQVLRVSGVDVDLTPDINPASSEKVTITVPGASTTGSSVTVSPTDELPDGIIISYARVVSNNSVEVKIYNASAVQFSPATLKFNVVVIQ